MLMRVGLPASTGALPRAARDLGTAVLISANSLWDPKASRFRAPGAAIDGLDVALDSAGFVAMTRYGGYRWSIEQYVELAASYPWAWWAAMDFCCEPEVASRPSVVAERVERTACYLWACRFAAARLRDEGAVLSDPMPVLQGWTPDNYAESIRRTGEVLDGEWPALVGVGSVCRRRWGGPEGLGAVLRRIFELLPPHVGVHLFGVKGDALELMSENPRIISADSMAWDSAARWATPTGEPCTVAARAESMREWFARQCVESKQQPLFGA